MGRLVSLPSAVVLMALACLCGGPTWAQQPSAASKPVPDRESHEPRPIDQLVDKIAAQEKSLVSLMANLHPVIETYQQYTKPDAQLGSVPVGDDYFLGQFSLSADGVSESTYLKPVATAPRLLQRVSEAIGDRYEANEFARALLIDSKGIDRHRYVFSFVRHETLGDVRCLVMDVRPLPAAKDERFVGRIWVEDQGYHIVRFNGTFTAEPRLKPGLHFDSWRLNLLPNVWLPAYLYSEESAEHSTFGRESAFKALSRVWGYDLQHAGDFREFAQPLSEEVPELAFRKRDSGYDLSPQFSKRRYQYSTEDNIIERLQVAGLMAPKGPVDEILQQVVTNLEITNQLEMKPEIRCRVLLTSPLESFSFGHTIVVSRGLLDVLPDEGSLAAVLAHELAHIILGHGAEGKYASADSLMFPNDKTLQKLDFSEDDQKEHAADAKAMELLAKSPYKDKLSQVGLFLEQLQARGNQLPNLIRPNLGNGLLDAAGVRMASLEKSAPKLAPERIDQIAALPLGSRIVIDPWSDAIQLRKPAAVAIQHASEKMPFEITPPFPYLKRLPVPH